MSTGNNGVAADKPRYPEILSLAQIMLIKYAPPRWAVPGILAQGLTILAGKPKMGKAQPLTSLVLTPFGYKLMADIKVGSEVIGRDGRVTRVLAIHPQGRVPIYRVTMSDGTATETTADHFWHVQSHEQRVWRSPGGLLTTEQIRQKISNGRKRFAYLPMAEPVQFAPLPVPLPIDPYLLGLLIGDGGLTKGITFTTGDPELFQEVSKRIPADTVSHLFPDGRSVSIRKRDDNTNRASSLQTAFQDLGLFRHKSEEKFIPNLYHIAPVGARLALLRGLMDTDGHNQGNAVQFVTTSQRLAYDFRSLVESLGGCATLNRKEKNGYYKAGEYHACRASYIITFRLPAELGCPFYLARKVNEWMLGNVRRRRVPLRQIVSVEPIGTAQAQCITVGASDGLYLTDHCIVTHNSWMCLGMGLSIAYGGRAFGQVQVDQGEVLYLALEDTPETVQERAALINPNLSFPSNFYVHTEWARMGEGGLLHLSNWLEDHPACRLVMVDTLGRIKPLQTKARSLYDEDYRIGAALKTVADKFKVALCCLHHLRKAAADDPMDTISATLGLTGAADQMIVLARDRGRADATMHITGRRVREQELALKFDDQVASWALVGQAEDFRKSKERAEIIKVLTGAPTPMTPTEVSGVLGKKVNTVKYLMWKMANEGDLKSVDGRYSAVVTTSANPANPANRTTLDLENGIAGDTLLMRMGHFSSELQSSTVSGQNTLPLTPLTVVSKVGPVSRVVPVSTVSAREHSGEVCLDCGVPLARGWIYLCSECEAKQHHQAGTYPEEELDDA